MKTKWGENLQREPNAVYFWRYFNVPPPQPREEEEGDDESMSPADWDNAADCPWGPDNDFNHYYDRL